MLNMSEPHHFATAFDVRKCQVKSLCQRFTIFNLLFWFHIKRPKHIHYYHHGISDKHLPHATSSFLRPHSSQWFAANPQNHRDLKDVFQKNIHQCFFGQWLKITVPKRATNLVMFSTSNWLYSRLKKKGSSEMDLQMLKVFKQTVIFCDVFGTFFLRNSKMNGCLHNFNKLEFLVHISTSTISWPWHPSNGIVTLTQPRLIQWPAR